MLLKREKARGTNDIRIMDSYFTVCSHVSGQNHEPTLSKLTVSALWYKDKLYVVKHVAPSIIRRLARTRIFGDSRLVTCAFSVSEWNCIPGRQLTLLSQQNLHAGKSPEKAAVAFWPPFYSLQKQHPLRKQNNLLLPKQIHRGKIHPRKALKQIRTTSKIEWEAPCEIPA